MVSGITASRLVAVMLLLLLAATRVEGADICSEVKNTARSARDALLAYHEENLKYPDQLSSTAFNPPEHMVVIYENMNLNPSRQMFMVRAYDENCGSMYLAVPATREIFEIPLTAEKPEKSATKPLPERAVPFATTSSGLPLFVSLVIFLMVFVIIVLLFYILYRKPFPAKNLEKDRQSPPDESK